MSKTDQSEVEDICRRISGSETKFQTELYGTMDIDFDLWALQPMAIKGIEPSVNYNQVTKIISLDRDTEKGFVSPSPRAFADLIHSRVTASERQITVRAQGGNKGGDRDLARDLELLVAYALEKNDERLTMELNYPPLLDYLVWSGMIRGIFCVRTLVKEGEDGRSSFDFMPLDPRYVKYEMGSKGKLWISSSTFRSAAAIKDEYGKDAADEDNNEVHDVWKVTEPGKKVKNYIIHNRELMEDAIEYDLPTIPVLYLTVPGVPPIKSLRELVNKHGTSIYAGAREIFRFENELISMWASHAELLFRQPLLNYFGTEGKELSTTAYFQSAVMNLPMGQNKLEPAPVKDISPTIVNLIGLIGSLRQRITAPDIEYGELKNFPLSGTAINELQSAREKSQGPILRGLKYLYTGIANQIEQQIKNSGMKTAIEAEVNREYYASEIEPVILDTPHITRVEFVVRTAWNQLDTYQVADMAQRLGLPDEFIWEYILKVPDPKGMKELGMVEDAEHSPILRVLGAIKKLIEDGREGEAKAVGEDFRRQWLSQEQGAEGAVAGNE